MKKRILASVLVAIMMIASLSACGSKAEEGNNAETSGKKTVTTGNDATPAGSAEGAKGVTITLGIWPEDTLTDDIAVHEGYVATMKELHPEVTCVPAYYKYATDTFMSMVEVNGKMIATGEGKSKKLSEMQAAKRALRVLNNH